ncbi:MAG TPA: hypothetical protein VEK76_11590 [Candidatus Binatia bacterium]|nr:hypothetical protein [Candidatus Binatia bacterium]
MGPSEGTASEREHAEVHRRLIEFLRALRDLDAALGPWRPDYGGLPARLSPDPDASGDLAEAHRHYAEGLGYFADHPQQTWNLGQPSREDVAAAIADAMARCGSPVLPMELLSPDGWSADHQLAGKPGPGVTTQGPRARWQGRRETAPGIEEAAPDGERPSHRGIVVAVGLMALLVTVVIVVAVVLAAHLFLGQGPTAAGPVATPTPATLPPESVSSLPLPDVLGAASACAAIPSGELPATLGITASSSGIGVDPATGYGTPYVSVELQGPVGAGTPSFALVTAILPFSAAAPSSPPPIDRVGTVQLIAYWDGAHWYGALRSWQGAAWTAPSPGSGAGVDVAQDGTTVTLYWQGLTSGDHYGEVVATSQGCAGHDLGPSLSPTQTYGG